MFNMFFFPFLIGDLIPEGELAWQVILDLKEIVELVVAPVHTNKTIAYLNVKVFCLYVAEVE